MISINWFEAHLPSGELRVPFQHLADGEQIPKRQKSISYRTVLRTKISKLYHITAQPPEGLDVEPMMLEDDPTIVKYIIEHGFGLRLQKAGFDVRLRHLGGVGYIKVKDPPDTSIYIPYEGIKFRCFYFYGEPTRWGLVLSYTTSQRFSITLQNSSLRNYAIGKRIVPQNRNRDEAAEKIDDIGIYPGILKSVHNNKGVVIDRDGNEQSIILDDWILPCSIGNLLGYIRDIENPRSANNAYFALQKMALTLTSENRMNTSLAKDQLQKLKNILNDNSLLEFQLPLPGEPPARISKDQITIGRQ